MGGWKMEVWRMGCYVMFPVAIFHYFNRSEMYEDWTTKMHHQMYPPEDPKVRQQLEQLANELRAKDDMELLKSLESLDTKSPL